MYFCRRVDSCCDEIAIPASSLLMLCEKIKDICGCCWVLDIQEEISPEVYKLYCYVDDICIVEWDVVKAA